MKLLEGNRLKSATFYGTLYRVRYKRTGAKEIVGAITYGRDKSRGFHAINKNNSCLTGNQALIFEKRKSRVFLVLWQAAGYKGNYLVETKIHPSVSNY